MKRIKKWLDIIAVPISKNGEFFVFMYMLSMVSAACTVFYHWKQELYDFSWWEVGLWLYVISALLSILPNVIRKIERGIIYFIAYGISIVDVYCFVKFESPINPSMLMLISETNTKEATEFFSAYVSPEIVFSNVGWVLLVLICHILWTIHRMLKKPKGLIIAEGKAEEFVKRGQQVAGITLLAFLITAFFLSKKNLSELYPLMTKNTLGEVEHKLTEKDCGKQFLPIYRTVFSIYANNLAAKQIDILHKVSKEVEVDSCSFTSPEIVLIIGESYNKSHSQLYGYQYPTTPRQLKMKKEGLLVDFTDVVTSWNLTSFVFKHMMSTYVVGDKGDWCDYPLFAQIFRKAGYHTTFLTNEFLPKAKQAVYDFSGGFFLNDPQLSAEQFDARNNELHVFDDALIRDYLSLQEKEREEGDTLWNGRLTIFHLIGQHQDYRIRCPNSKKRFKPEDYSDRTDLKPKWKKNLANYDNATLYNDSIVERITHLFKDKDAIAIYVPDHGEEVHSRELPHFSGRMHSTKIIKRLAREEFEIPFWIWTSPTYQKNHPEICQRIHLAANKPYMIDALSHTLMFLAGIHCKYYRPEYDILSPEYNSKRPRILKNQTDYDLLMERKHEKFNPLPDALPGNIMKVNR